MSGGRETESEQAVHMSSLALLFMSLYIYHIVKARLAFFDSMTYECVYFVHEAMILYCEKRG